MEDKLALFRQQVLFLYISHYLALNDEEASKLSKMRPISALSSLYLCFIRPCFYPAAIIGRKKENKAEKLNDVRNSQTVLYPPYIRPLSVMYPHYICSKTDRAFKVAIFGRNKGKTAKKLKDVRSSHASLYPSYICLYPPNSHFISAIYKPYNRPRL